MFQTTIKKEISFKGIGVHSGEFVEAKVLPAPANSGIRFCSAKDPGNYIQIGTIIPVSAMHATVIKKDSFHLSTIEHLMAAIIMLEIDNVIVEMTGGEVPILDGSALPFVQGLMSSGICEFDVNKKFLTVTKDISFSDGKGRFISLSPAKSLVDGGFDKSLYIDYKINFKHHLVGEREIKGLIDNKFFVEQLAPARTFGFLEQFPDLKKYGLAKGTSLGNTVVIGDNEFLNEPRMDDEFAKHKILDFIGDLGLLGKKFAGTVVAEKTGHSFNRLVVEHYIKNRDLWMLI